MLRAAGFDFLDKLLRPLPADRQHIVGDPHDVRFVSLLEHQHFIYDIFGRALPMGVTEYFARTPRAVEGASASGDQRNRTLAVMRLPCLEIVVHLENVAVGPGKAV